VYNENPNKNEFQPIVVHAEKDAADIFHADFVLQTNADNGRVSFVMGAGPQTYGFLLQGNALPFNKWTHIAVTVAAQAGANPTSAKLYMNGELVAQQNQWNGGAGTRQVTNNGITVGYANFGGQVQNWVGQVDELRFWDVVRTQASIVRDHKDPFLFSDPVDIPANLVAYYSFDAGPDTAVWDNSRQPYYDGLPFGGQERADADGVVDIPPSPLLAPFAGPEAHALQFTGAHDTKNSVRLPAELSRALPRGFTFEAWIYLEAETIVDQHYKTIAARWNPSAAAEQPGTYEAGSNPEADFVFQVDPRNGRLVFFMGGGRGDCEKTSLGYGVALFSSGEYNVKPYEWTHVAFSVIATNSADDPFSAKLYKNGVEVPQAPELPGNAWRAECHRNFLRFEPIHIGYYDNGIEQYWEGRIDEVRVWSEPRDNADIAADFIRPLAGRESNLLAYYPFDEGTGTTIADATPHNLHGTADKPLWVPSQGPTELVDGVSGFPVHVTLIARSPPPNDNDSFEFIITELPSNGGLFTTGQPIELITQADVDNKRVIDGSQITYVSNIGYTGFDTFGYAAISDSTGLTSETHFVVANVAAYTTPGDNCVPDACGVCNGDGSSCVGGCDGKGGEIDVCGVCGGGGASCTCVYYKTFHTDELDCVLFQNQVNRTLARVENTIVTLHRALTALETFDQACWRNNFFDLGVMLEFLCGFNNGCLPPWEEKLAEFEDSIKGELELCEPVPFNE